MKEATWKEFLTLYWTTIAYWEFVKAYREKPLSGAAMVLASTAVRNCLLITIDKFVELCRKTSGHKKEDLRPDFGEKGLKAFKELVKLAERGKDGDDYIDCGVSVFRDMELGHPLNAIKAVLGKDQFQISLNWRTVEDTIALITKFMDDVESYHCDNGTWEFSSVKGQMIDIQDDFRGLVIKFEDAAKYDNLARQILRKGGRAEVQVVERHDVELVDG